MTEQQSIINNQSSITYSEEIWGSGVFGYTNGYQKMWYKYDSFNKWFSGLW